MVGLFQHTLKITRGPVFRTTPEEREAHDDKESPTITEQLLLGR